MKLKFKKSYGAITGLLLLMSAIVLIFCSCSQAPTYNEGQTITDIYGRNVVIPSKVEKIATVGSATRICVYAGAADKLIAITESDKDSELKPYTVACANKFKNLPTTNNGNHLNSTTVDKEKMLSLAPDVIISTRSADECDALQKDLNIPVVGVYFQDEIFSDAVYNSIKIAALTANTSDIANDKINYLKQTEQDLTNRCTNTTSKVYRGAINFKGSKDLRGTISNYCVYKAIKANNVADKEGFNSAYDTNLEQIISWDPDYIFMDYTNSEKIANLKNKNGQAFANIRAINDSNAYYVATFNNNGTNIEYGLCEAYYTAKILYPKEFEDVNIDDKFTEIFEKIDGSDIYKELINRGVYFGPAKV